MKDATSEQELGSEDVLEAVLDLSKRLVHLGLVRLLLLDGLQLLSARWFLHDSLCILLLLSDDAAGNRRSFLGRLDSLERGQRIAFL